MAITSTVSGPGQTVVRIHDDSGAPFSFVSSAISLLAQTSLQEVIQIPLKRDDTASPPRPALTHGQIIVNAQAVFDPALADYALADVEVRGYVGAIYTVLARAQLGGAAPLLRVTFEDQDCFEKIAIAAAELVDGERKFVIAPNVSTLQLSALAFMWGA